MIPEPWVTMLESVRELMGRTPSLVETPTVHQSSLSVSESGRDVSKMVTA